MSIYGNKPYTRTSSADWSDCARLYGNWKVDVYTKRCLALLSYLHMVGTYCTHALYAYSYGKAIETSRLLLLFCAQQMDRLIAVMTLPAVLSRLKNMWQCYFNYTWNDLSRLNTVSAISVFVSVCCDVFVNFSLVSMLPMSLAHMCIPSLRGVHAIKNSCSN